MISHYTNNQRRVMFVKRYFSILTNAKFGSVMRFVANIVSLKNIKFQLKVLALGIDLDYKRSTIQGIGCQQSSGGPLLDRIMKMFRISPTDTVIDIGSGKGGAIITLCQYPFGKVDGIEIDSESWETSRRNLSKVQHGNTTIYLGDARAFGRYADYNFFYVFNSFSGKS